MWCTVVILSFLCKFLCFFLKLIPTFFFTFYIFIINSLLSLSTKLYNFFLILVICPFWFLPLKTFFLESPSSSFNLYFCLLGLFQSGKCEALSSPCEFSLYLVLWISWLYFKLVKPLFCTKSFLRKNKWEENIFIPLSHLIIGGLTMFPLSL